MAGIEKRKYRGIPAATKAADILGPLRTLTGILDGNITRLV